jgi:hypothetical protein
LEGRYNTLTNQGEDFQFEGDESKRSFKQQLLSHTIYQSDIRARENIEYSAMELNLDQVTNQGTGFNPKKLTQIRTNFDAVAEGRYEKKLEPKVMKYVETQADAAYRKETGTKEVDRNSQVWKTMRNVELLKYDRTLWNTVQEPAAGTDVSKTMTDQSNNPDLGSNSLNRPGQEQTLNRDHLTQPETFPAGTGQKPQQPVGGGFDSMVNPELTKPLEGFPTNQPVDGVTNVFMAKPGEIPGIDIPFRKVNPKYPANQEVLKKARSIDVEAEWLDCSEIADDLLKAANGKGRIIEVTPSKGKDLTLYELGKEEKFKYHQVYTDGQYVYDPRASSDPIPKGDWEIMVRSLNPGAVFK